MSLVQLFFFIAIALAAIVRVSIIPRRGWIPVTVCWGMVAVAFTYYMSGLTPEETTRLLCSDTLVICEFAELMLFIAIVFSSAKGSRIISRYPGIMIAAPIAWLSAIASRSFPGIDFMIPAIVAGGAVCVVSALLIFLCRFLRWGKETLYKVSLFGFLICIIYYGIQ